MKQVFARVFALVIIFGINVSVYAAEKTLQSLPFSKRLELARAGDVEAKMAVAQAYETGAGVRLNTVEAAKWYREAALAGQLDAQYRLALMVERGGPGLTADKTAAAKLLETAAQRGHALSQNRYGKFLQTGEGVTKSDTLAAKFYLAAAKQGLPDAQNNYGTMLLNGWGVDRDLDQAFQWFSKAAAQGNAWGLNNLGAMYESGYGTAKDMDKARDSYQRAAALGLETARQNLERLNQPQ